jgi:hypothetical protein
MLGSHLLFAIDKQLYMVITSGVDKSNRVRIVVRRSL